MSTNSRPDQPQHGRQSPCRSGRSRKKQSRARCVTVQKKPARKQKGLILIITAGTSDIPVAEEARVTVEIMGGRVDTIYDAGVAGQDHGFVMMASGHRETEHPGMEALAGRLRERFPEAEVVVALP